MLNPKYFFLIASLITVGAYADKLDKDGILRNDDDSIHYMNQYEASGVDTATNQKVKPDVCTAFGAHLPTIRELAKDSQALGAKGILETTQVKDGAVPEHYFLVDATNPDGKQDKFYFNSDGYERPQGDLGSNWFWSSSVPSYDSYYAYDLYGYYGDVDNWNRADNFNLYAVRCDRTQ